MNTLKGLFAGLGIGFMVFWISAIWACISCTGSAGTSYLGLGMNIIVGGLIGALIGMIIDISDGVRTRNIENQVLLDHALEDWRNQVVNIINQIFTGINNGNSVTNYADELHTLLNYRSNKDIRYEQESHKMDLYVQQNIEQNALNLIRNSSGRYILKPVYCAAEFLSIYNHTNIYDQLLIGIRAMLNYLQRESYILDPRKYGIVSDMWEVNVNETLLAERCFSNERLIFRDDSLPLAMMYQWMNDRFLTDVYVLMCYYARQKPFNADKFNRTCRLYNRFTASYFDDGKGRDDSIRQVVRLDVLLAKLYAYYKMGGSGVIDQFSKEIEDWRSAVLSWKDTGTCCVLAAGFAWLNLQRYEQETLRAIVTQGLKITPFLQERLGLLEMGDGKSMKIYNIVNNRAFNYDSSSVKWEEKDFTLFFRNLKFREKAMEYSLAMEAWEETRTVTAENKITIQSLYNQLQVLVREYDGDIRIQMASAYAVDVLNGKSMPSILISSKEFNYVSILIQCMKMGRNLTLNLFIMLSPVPGVPVDMMQQYMTLIKQKSYSRLEAYIKSIRESILQEVDGLLKVKKNIYEERQTVHNTPVTEKKIYFE